MLLSSSSQIRHADQIQIQEKNVPGILLMEEAGRLATEAILEIAAPDQAFLILAGPGNNGGDGLVIARRLHLANREVQVLLSHAPERYQGDALLNYQILGELPVPLWLWEEEEWEDLVESFPSPPLLVDALLGTGIQAELRDPVSSILTAVQRQDWPVIAIDLPSGLSADTGEAINQAVAAQETLTFQLPKICHAVYPAAALCGHTQVLDIGIWPEVIAELSIQRVWLDDAWFQEQRIVRPKEGHKGTFGHVGLIGGSRNMAGAMALTSLGALHSGAGLVSVLTPMSCRQTILNHCPEAMVIGLGDLMRAQLAEKDLPRAEALLDRKQAIAIGPGLGTGEQVAALISGLLPRIQVPLVLDADALNLLAEHPEWWAMLPDATILTPHPGEMKRLMGLETPISRRLELAEQLAQQRQVIVVLKGAGTIIALPDGRTFVNSNGNPGMGTGGMGDVLTGIIASLLAQGYEPGIAAAMGVFLHGKAGDAAARQYGEMRVSARAVIEHLADQ